MGQTTASARILIVDDEDANVTLLQRLLQRAGYTTVSGTTDPLQVMSLLDSFQPDIILLDLNMPVLDGLTLLQQLDQRTDTARGEYLPVLVLTADISPQTKQKALTAGAKDFLTKPFDAAEVVARVANLVETRFLHVQLRRHNDLLEDRVRERTAELWTTITQLERAQQDLRHAHEETITSLSFAAEFRDDETARHIERMSCYCSVIAGAVGIDDEHRETLRVAAKMHDVGKIGIPDSILLKPGKLTDDEFEIMKNHAQIGYDILSGPTSDLAATAAAIARTHHEKVDGSGYPRGLVGDQIPLEGRIAAVADVFDALTTNRVYRKAFELPDALSIMHQGRGTHFDPEILDVFFDRIDEILRMKHTLDEAAA